MVPRKGALNAPEEACALCWCQGHAQGMRAREEHLQGERPARLDAEVSSTGQDGLSGAGAPGPVVACGDRARGAKAR